jgi:hypothetical protein
VACENASLSQAGHFGHKASQEQLTKVSKTQGGNTPLKTSATKPPTGGMIRPPSAKKGTYVASASTRQPTNQPVDNKQKGTLAMEDKEILSAPSNLDKKLWITTDLDHKLELTLVTFLRDNLDVFAWKISDMPRIPRELIEHKLGIDQSYKPIKQKERRYTPKRRGTIRQ